MRINRKLLKNAFLVLLFVLPMQMAGPQFLAAATVTTLTASPTSVPADGFTPSLITATIVIDGAPPALPPGVDVTFTTNIGIFSSGSRTITTTTDAAGKSVVPLTSDGAGLASVTCHFVGFDGFDRVVRVNFSEIPQPTPTPLPAVLSSFVLSVDPPAVPADNVTPSTITAQLFDQYGETFPTPGVTIVFTTTPAGLARFSNDQTTISVSTDATGKAAALLYSPAVGTATVGAKVGALTTNPVYVNFTGAGPTVDIVLTADPASIPADNQSSSTITATLYDQNGQTVQAGVSVNFATTLGIFSNGLTTATAFTNDEGVASIVLYAGSSVGNAQVSAGTGGVTRYVYVAFTGVGPPAFISLSATPGWIPANGYSYTAITAVILDSTGQPVAAGTVVTFTTTLGVFENGMTTFQVVTTDDTGTVTVHLRATSTFATGSALITCTAGAVTQAITVGIVRLEYETEPNNEMSKADGICFDRVYLSQLFSPYDEDWYTFTIALPSRIGINFITTAAPADAGCDSGTTTVGTWKVDIRDKDNNILMSYHNIDCIFDNGIWETGVMPPGTYYIVVYCPRLGGMEYLSDLYYMAVFNNFYFPCGDRDKLVNLASLALEGSTYRLHVPIIDMNPYVWADFQYDPVQGTGLMFRLSDAGVLTNLDEYRACNMANLSLVDGNYVLHVPVVMLNGISYRVELTYVPTTDAQMWFMLSGAWLNNQ